MLDTLASVFESPEALISASVVAALIVLGALFLIFLVGRGASMIAKRTNLERFELVPFERIVRVFIGVAGILLVFSAFGFPLEGLWTAFTAIIAMVAIGFVAVWSVLSNTLCTLIILMFRPFSIGDEISFPGEEVKGQVVDLTLIYTTLKSEEGELFQVPNSLFLQRSIRRRTSSSVHPSLAEQLRAEQPAPDQKA